MPLVVTDQCANCRVCLPACPVDCFFEDEAADRVYINPTECIGCLCCYLICPHDAIYPQDQVPADKSAWIARNAERATASGARRLRPTGAYRPTSPRVQGRSAATASRGQQRIARRPPGWWNEKPKRRPPIPTYDPSAGLTDGESTDPTPVKRK